MLVSNTSKRDGSQWPLKTRPCQGGCGSLIEYRLKPKRFCADCASIHGAQSPGALAQRRYRERQASGHEGFSFTCEVCGCAGVGRVPHRKWCDSCEREGRRRHSAAKNLASGCVPFGTTFSCKNCTTEVVKEFRTQHYCGACSDLAKADKLPAYAERKRTYFAQYVKDRRARDPMFALNGRMKAQVVRSLVYGKGGRSWPALVGYDLQQLAAHLEARFLPGMTWENRGKWHIDHIRPLCSFEFQTPDDPQFREAWALSNLQPLWAKDNLSKGGRWEPLAA